MKNIVLRPVLLVFCFSFSLFFCQAQEKRVSGTVTDENSNALVGATVSVKGTSNNTITDAAGKFSITVPQQSKTIVISYVGMQPQSINISNSSTIRVSLHTSVSTLNDVVVIGYGTIKRANVSSSISSVSEKDIKNLPVAGLDQAIQGKVAGVSITNNSGQPGGGVSVRVRGITSVNGTEPLYVVDGVPILTNTSSTPQDQLGGKAGQTQQVF